MSAPTDGARLQHEYIHIYICTSYTYIAAAAAGSYEESESESEEWRRGENVWSTSIMADALGTSVVTVASCQRTVLVSVARCHPLEDGDEAVRNVRHESRL